MAKVRQGVRITKRKHKPPVYFLLLAAVIISSLLHLGALKDPGLGEGVIKAAWVEFDNNHNRYKVGTHYPFMGEFQKAAKRHNLPVTLLLAVARGESSFNPKAARHDSNCHGLMQIQWPGTAKDMGVQRKEDLYRPEINIEAGAKYLAWLKRYYDKKDPKHSTYLTLAAYNYGLGRVEPDKVPDGAQWYASYIYRDNLMKIVKVNYEAMSLFLVNEYTYYDRAVEFQELWSKMAPNVKLEIKKSNKYTCDLYIAYKDEADRLRSIDLFCKSTGFRPMGLN